MGEEGNTSGHWFTCMCA